MAGDVEEVLEVLVAGAQQGPDGAGAFEGVAGLPLAGVVAEEAAVEAGVCVLHQLDLRNHGNHGNVLLVTTSYQRWGRPTSHQSGSVKTVNIGD